MYLQEPQNAISVLPVKEEEEEEKIENAAPSFKKELGQWSFNYEKNL